MKSELDSVEKAKQDLIVKISTLENGMIEKIDFQRVREDAYTKLQNLYRS